MPALRIHRPLPREVSNGGQAVAKIAMAPFVEAMAVHGAEAGGAAVVETQHREPPARPRCATWCWSPRPLARRTAPIATSRSSGGVALFSARVYSAGPARLGEAPRGSRSAGAALANLRVTNCGGVRRRAGAGTRDAESGIPADEQHDRGEHERARRSTRRAAAHCRHGAARRRAGYDRGGAEAILGVDERAGLTAGHERPTTTRRATAARCVSGRARRGPTARTERPRTTAPRRMLDVRTPIGTRLVKRYLFDQARRTAGARVRHRRSGRDRERYGGR